MMMVVRVLLLIVIGNDDICVIAIISDTYTNNITNVNTAKR